MKNHTSDFINNHDLLIYTLKNVYKNKIVVVILNAAEAMLMVPEFSLLKRDNFNKWLNASKKEFIFNIFQSEDDAINWAMELPFNINWVIWRKNRFVLLDSEFKANG